MAQTDRVTYDRWALKTLIPAQGWQVVLYDNGAEKHILLDVHALALAYRRTRDARAHVLIPDVLLESEDEGWDIVGLDYHPIEGWLVWSDVSNFCGLLPPGRTLADFAGQCACHPANAREEG
jgi:hypothetical protein